jgi:hypothetical protein
MKLKKKNDKLSTAFLAESLKWPLHPMADIRQLLNLSLLIKPLVLNLNSHNLLPTKSLD